MMVQFMFSQFDSAVVELLLLPVCVIFVLRPCIVHLAKEEELVALQN